MRCVRIGLDPSAREPLSTQLVAAIERRVERGWLLPGERLPSVRELAARLDLAPNTVAKAYRMLERSGVLVGRGRHGTFVADRPPAPVRDADARLERAAEAFARRARQLGVSSGRAQAAVRAALRRPPER